jgi:EmrB/QacA subfamily drug resistance transporter
VAYVTAVLLSAIDLQIVNVALPTLGRSFHASIASVQWTVVGYILSLAVMIPASGWIGDRIGTKRTYLCALGIFTVASALCGAARTLDELIAARLVQGIGGGILTPTGTAMLFRSVPPERRARITRLLVLPILVGPASAPILGGVFTQYLSWRWVFFVNLPVGLAVFAYCAVNLREQRGGSGGRFDAIGWALGGGGLSLALFALAEAPVRGFGSPAIIATGATAAAVLALFVRHAYRRADPILNLRLLDDRLFRATNVVSCLNTGAFLGILFLTPIFLQEALHHSPISSGTTTFLEALGVLIASQSVFRLYPRLGPRRMAGGGAVVVCGLLLCFQLVDTSTSLWLVRGQMLLLGAANGVSFLAIQASMFTRISPADTGHAAAIYTSGRQASTAICVAILSSVLVGVAGPRLDAFHAAFLAAASISALGALASFTLIKTPDAAASMSVR